MILVDSSVWIDYFRGIRNTASDKLHDLLGVEELAIGDLILAEVLQGIPDDRTFEMVRRFLAELAVVELGGVEMAVRAARNYRTLRRLGVTVRKTIDAFIATRCIEAGYELLHNDRDFDPFVEHLGLRSAI